MSGPHSLHCQLGWCGGGGEFGRIRLHVWELQSRRVLALRRFAGPLRAA
jgi:hypothetical protein